MSKKVILSRRLFYFLLCGTFFSVLAFFNLTLQVAAKEDTDSDNYKQLKVFTNVISLVQRNYVEPVSIKPLVEGALKGMLYSLDPHSSYMNEESYKELVEETKGEFAGLGIEITVKEGVLTVVAAIEDSPAQQVGVKAGDQIIKIGSEFAKNLTLVDAIKKMRGPKGSSVTLYIHRKDRPNLLPFSIVRDVIKVTSVRSRMLEDRYGYIRLVQFQEDSADEFQKALTELAKKSKEKKLEGLVIDLRNNPGGLLNQATRISDLFLKDGVIVYTDGRLESQKQKFYAHDDGNEPEFPIILLVNGGSASASEIVAGAFQDAGRAVILGTQTFGKGSVQTILRMDNGGALRLTTALYYTKNGRSIQAQGITPEVKVEDLADPEDLQEGTPISEVLETKEKDLPGAIKNPGKNQPANEQSKSNAVSDELQKVEGPKIGNLNHAKVNKQKEERIAIGSRQAMTADLEKVLKDDPQLTEALKLLKTWNVFKGKPGGANAVQAQASSSSQLAGAANTPQQEPLNP